MKTRLQDYLLLTLGALALAVNLDVFLAPHAIAPGGVSGVAIIINHYFGWPVGTLMLLLNLPLLVLGYRHLGRLHFLARTVFVVLLYNLGANLLQRWLPAAGVTQDLMLNALYGGVLGGVGTGLVYRGGGTAAGTGILGRVLQMRTGFPMSNVYMLTDGGVIIAAGIAFGWDRALYALVALFVWGLVADYILEGPSVVRTVFIVTDYAEAVSQAVLTRLGLGVTAWTAKGGYTANPHTVLFCTVSRPEVQALETVVRAADAAAFVVVGHGHQASGGIVRQVKSP